MMTPDMLHSDSEGIGALFSFPDTFTLPECALILINEGVQTLC